MRDEKQQHNKMSAEVRAKKTAYKYKTLERKINENAYQASQNGQHMK